MRPAQFGGAAVRLHRQGAGARCAVGYLRRQRCGRRPAHRCRRCLGHDGTGCGAKLIGDGAGGPGDRRRDLDGGRRPHGHSAIGQRGRPWDGRERHTAGHGQRPGCVGAVKATIPTGGECHRLAAVAVVVYRNSAAAQLIPAGRAVIVRVPYLRALEDVVSLVATLVLGVAGAVVYPQVEGDGTLVLGLILR